MDFQTRLGQTTDLTSVVNYIIDILINAIAIPTAATTPGVKEMFNQKNHIFIYFSQKIQNFHFF